MLPEAAPALLTPKVRILAPIATHHSFVMLPHARLHIIVACCSFCAVPISPSSYAATMTYSISVPTFYNMPDLSHKRTRAVTPPPNRERAITPPPSPRKSSQANSLANTASVNSVELEEGRSLSPDPIKDTTCVHIPKPTGEVGRPERGGYNLRAVLSANPTLYNEVLVCLLFDHILRLISKFLAFGAEAGQNTFASGCLLFCAIEDVAAGRYSRRELCRIDGTVESRADTCRKQGETQSRDLADYENAWPLDDALCMRLKYTSARARQQAGTVKLRQPMQVSPRKKVKFDNAAGGSSK
jgi:hypothetical protein